MKLLFNLGFVVVLLTSCATMRDYEHAVEQWNGKSENELTKVWGKPAEVEPLADGGRMFTYVRTTDPHLIRDPASRKTVILPDCRTSFLINSKSVIIGWKYEGPNCRSH